MKQQKLTYTIRKIIPWNLLKVMFVTVLCGESSFDVSFWNIPWDLVDFEPKLFRTRIGHSELVFFRDKKRKRQCRTDSLGIIICKGKVLTYTYPRSATAIFSMVFPKRPLF